MRRIGHSRPAGTTWRARIHSWQRVREPALGDRVCEDPETLYRGFLVVGVEETANPTVWHVTLERTTWQDFLDAVERGEPSWAFVRDRR